jgi:hypothetical protein
MPKIKAASEAVPANEICLVYLKLCRHRQDWTFVISSSAPTLEVSQNSLKSGLSLLILNDKKDGSIRHLRTEE